MYRVVRVLRHWHLATYGQVFSLRLNQFHVMKVSPFVGYALFAGRVTARSEESLARTVLISRVLAFQFAIICSLLHGVVLLP